MPLPPGAEDALAGRGCDGTRLVSIGQGSWLLLPLVKGGPVSGEGQALPQFIPLPGHQPQLNGEVLHLLIHLAVSEEGRGGRCLPGGSWQEGNNKENWHLGKVTSARL